MAIVDEGALDVLFRDARSQNGWLPGPVADETLQELYDVMKWGPTSANGFPMRVLFLKSQEERDKLATVAMSGNQEKIKTAPVVAILANDQRFFERMDKLFPHNPGMAELFENDQEIAEITAFRNGTLQGAYFMIAARAVGLDCGPMSGFDNAACDALFFPDGQLKSNFICALGKGDPDKLFDRLPRPSFDEVSEIR